MTVERSLARLADLDLDSGPPAKSPLSGRPKDVAPKHILQGGKLRRSLFKGLIAAVASPLIFSSVFIGASSANAAFQDNVCNFDEVCLYDNSGYNGSKFDDYVAINYYPSYNFVGTSKSIEDEVASAVNYDDVYAVRMYQHHNYTPTSPVSNVWTLRKYAQCPTPGSLNNGCYYAFSLAQGGGAGPGRSSHNWLVI